MAEASSVPATLRDRLATNEPDTHIARCHRPAGWRRSLAAAHANAAEAERDRDQRGNDEQRGEPEAEKATKLRLLHKANLADTSAAGTKVPSPIDADLQIR